MATRKTVSLNQIDLSYLDWQTDGEPVLLLHGLADHALIWSAVGDQLATHYHPIAVDMRGHGESSKPDGSAIKERIEKKKLDGLVCDVVARCSCE